MAENTVEEGLRSTVIGQAGVGGRPRPAEVHFVGRIKRVGVKRGLRKWYNGSLGVYGCACHCRGQ